jgi:hypothetical protein
VPEVHDHYLPGMDYSRHNAMDTRRRPS